MSDQAHDDKHHEALRLFGSRVKRFRNEQGLTQERFAEMIGKTVEHVSYLERGERYPSFEVIVDIAEALSVSPAHLLSAADAEGDRVLAEALPIAPSASLPDPVQETVPVIEKRRNDLERLQAAFRGLREMQRLADDYGVNDILQDNGGKVLQVLILLGLQISPGREGNDAVDDEGNEYELKTINRSLRRSAGITTHHHLTKDILDKYRAVKAWYIAFYEGIELKEIWKVLPEHLEEKFNEWEAKAESQGPINNPKIPIRFVHRGEQVYSSDD